MIKKYVKMKEREVSDLICFCENLVDLNEAHLNEATVLSYACMNFFLPVNSFSWWQAAFEWGSV